MKPLEIIRIISITIVGVVIMLLGQPWLYRSGFIPLDVPDIEQWIFTEYTSSTYWVLGAAVAATIIWYFAASTANPLTAKDTASWRLLWWLVLLLPIASIGIALSLQTEGTARLWLAAMYVLDVLVLYWLPTASSSPGQTKYLPPGSRNVRNLLEPV